MKMKMVTNVMKMSKITYLGKDYKVRTFHVEVTGHDYEAEYMIASDDLIDEMREHTGNDDCDFSFGSLEEGLDNMIYHYVDPKCLDLPAAEICEKWLDIPMKLINEIL